MIEALGKYLLDDKPGYDSNTDDDNNGNNNKANELWFPERLAVLCIDPSVCKH
jgi:hypothetical protein